MMTIATRMLRLGAAALFACLTAATAAAGPGDGTVLGATKIADNGPNSLRWNLVVIAEGFTSSQQDLFNSYAQQVVDEFYNRAQLQPYIPAINVIRLNVASDESGADDPLACGGSGVYVNTYFDATYCNGGIRRALVANNSLAIYAMNTWVPEWDEAVILVNSTVWGGTGGQISVLSLAPGWHGILVHELGHSAFGLGDEYEYWAGCGIDTDRNFHPAYEPSAPNSTIQTNRSLIKWRDLILPATPVPTTINADCSDCDNQGSPLPPSTIGLYEGADYYHCRAYRPRFTCMMRSSGYDWCAVCYREVDRVLTPYMATHINLTVHSANPASGVAITVSPPDTNNLSSGSTPFVRTYPRPSTVTLRAPSLAGGNSFAKWQRDGTDYSTADSISLYLDRNATMTATYLSCTDSAGPPWVDQSSPVCVDKQYCVNWHRLPGAATYEVRENGGIWISALTDTLMCFQHAVEGTYTYEVRPVSACGPGGPSPVVTMTVQFMAALSPPSQPTLIPAGPVCTGGQYTVRWNPVPDAITYQIRENGGTWQSTGSATIWSFIHTVTGGYTCEVRAINICSESNPSPPVTMNVAPCYDLIVYSLNPDAGVAVSAGPPDQNAQGSGSTPFARWYSAGTLLTLEAPATVNGKNLTKWQRDGADYATTPVITFNFDTTRTMTAVYSVSQLSVQSANAPRPVTIAIIPPDLNYLADDVTPFTRMYEQGSGVTLTAPAAAWGNPFVTWQRNGLDYPGGPGVTLTMDNDYTMTAQYHTVASVMVESKSVAAGPGIPIHVKLSNDVAIRKIVLPLEIRSVTSGAFISKLRVTYAERLMSYLTGMKLASQFANPDGTCKGGLAGGYNTTTTTMTPNVDVAVGGSPEGISLVRGRVADPALPAGADITGSIVLVVTATGIGTFEIDTTCTNPANHIGFTQEDPPTYTNILPAFTKGVITVFTATCSCPNQGDIDGGGGIDVFDVISVIGAAFSGAPDPQDPICPSTRSDVNYDGVTDVFDVIYLIATAFSGGPGPVDPCGT